MRLKNTMTTTPVTVRKVLGCLVLSALLPGQGVAQISPRLPRQEAQTSTAVQGIIRNTEGLGLGDAKIDFLLGTQTYHAVTTGDGVFRIRDLRPGTYQFSVSREGFQSFSKGGIFLNAGEALNFEVKLAEVPVAMPGRQVPLRT